MISFPSTFSVLAGLCFGAAIAVGAFYARALSRSGALAAAILGTIIFGLGGLAHTAVLLTFFLSSSLLSALFGKYKSSVNEKYAKGNRRDAGQVLANGGIAGLCVILGVLLPGRPVFWWMYCAALAAANADTWATELGVLSKNSPRLITTFRKVEMGTSGGITLIGSISAVAGACLIASISDVFQPGIKPLLWVTLAGCFGAFVDSWLGASVQAMYYCDTCQKETEKHPLHGCGTVTRLIHGWKWLDNDWVNTFCTLSAVALIMLLNIIVT
jgi:uncharacterized protein (TIGR00297 family)